MDQYTQANQALWDKLTRIHEQAEAYYDLEGFRTGKSSLRSIELTELGDVTGKSLLHLQCHFGMDTISWAKQGAEVTGADLSPEAIQLARSLADEMGVEANFVCSDLYDLPNQLQGQFDIVYTSYGVLCWLADLPAWAKVIAHFLKPGGIFYIVDGHPFSIAMENVAGPEGLDLRLRSSYFSTKKPLECFSTTDYADQDAVVNLPSFEWKHSLGDTITALAAAGLKIEFVHEFPYCDADYYDNMIQGEDGWWRFKGGHEVLPLTFSIMARKLSGAEEPTRD